MLGLLNKRLSDYRILLAIIFMLALAIRVFRINQPNTFYFDEVYHAFTAKEILNGNIKAWEWWNTPPAGFAYEWSHPPLAKLLMAAGMAIFGQNPLGWRLPSVILGSLTSVLIFFISKYLFKRNLIGLFGAFIFSFETLAFTQSRIGMNDTYFLFFFLASLLFFLKDKWFFASIFLGLALASKWTAVYALPFFGLIILIKSVNLKNKNYKNLLLKELIPFPVFFLIIPVLIYILSYLPLLIAHDFNIFWGLQKQMYWYHTSLTATHPFWSPWWSWPLDIRPIWYFSQSVNGKVSNIFAIVHPVIAWTGLVAIAASIFEIIYRKKHNLLIVLLGFLAFWLPWAFSPRIMFIYHYLPSIPFLVMMTAYFLAKIYSKFKIITIIYLLIIVLTFIYFYTFISAFPSSSSWHESHFWVPTWKPGGSIFH
ncbi:MAG TPA: glycosyltransferase family 39 protein [Patescibacteria group bacterium]